MKVPRLLAGALALLLLLAALAGLSIYAQRLEGRYIAALAPQMFAEKNRGLALQRAAFERSDLLPLYGSSDLNVPNPYHASALFRDYPTGFTIFPVGHVGSTSLIWLQSLAAVGCDLYGRKIALSVSARLFMNDKHDPHAYGANFSPVHANELAFSSCLGSDVKQAAARRMLEFPETLVDYPLLRFALERLAHGSLIDRVLYVLSWPLGKLYTLALRFQDHWETVIFLRAQLGLRPALPRGGTLDWEKVQLRAEEHTRLRADGNVFGFENDFWKASAPEISMQKGMYASVLTQQVMERSVEWADLDLLLQVIRSLGGELLILNIPMKGPYYDHLGVTSTVRDAYYERLRLLARTHGVRAKDFAEHDSDRYFSVDPAPHLSARGWVFYGRALDAFFHGRVADDS